MALTALAGSRDRGEADRARAVLLTLTGWTSPRIAEAFGVRDDAHARRLRDLGCDFGTGPAFGPPIVRTRSSNS